MTDETGVSIKATSVEPETETALLLGSHPREEPKTLCCSDTPNIPELPTGPLDRPTSTGVALAQDLYKRVVGEDDHGAATVASPPCAITPPLSPRREEERREEKRNAAFEEHEWEITKIVGRRRTRKGNEYKVRWRNTWLPRIELGNAQRLLQEYEAPSLAKRHVWAKLVKILRVHAYGERCKCLQSLGSLISTRVYYANSRRPSDIFTLFNLQNVDRALFPTLLCRDLKAMRYLSCHLTRPARSFANSLSPAYHVLPLIHAPMLFWTGRQSLQRRRAVVNLLRASHSEISDRPETNRDTADDRNPL